MMSAEQAEAFIIEKGTHLSIARVCLELAELTPRHFYMSQDLITAHGSDRLAGTFAIAAWDLDRDANGKAIEGEITVGSGDDFVRFDLLSPYIAMPGAEEDPADFSIAISVLKNLGEDDLSKIIGRLVDAAGGVIIHQGDSFMPIEGKGFRAAAMELRGAMDIDALHRFVALVLNTSYAERGFVCQIVASRAETPAVSSEKKFLFDANLEMYEDRLRPDSALEQAT